MWYIFRHGETFANVKQDRVQGHSKNIYLTLDGALQAHMNGVKLKKLEDNFSDFRIVCSPLERTINTCQIIMDEIGRGETPEYEELLMERSQGIFDGMLKEEIEKKYGDEYKKSVEHLWNYEAEGYENYKTILLKMAKFIEKYGNEKKLIIVAHDGINRCLMYMLETNNRVKDLTKWINGLSEAEGNEISKELKSRRFDQNYFYSWDGKEFKKV